MLSPALIEYLKQCKNQNRHWDDVLTEMRGHGWPDTMIAEAQKWYLEQTTAPAVTPNTSPATPQVAAPASIPPTVTLPAASFKAKILSFLKNRRVLKVLGVATFVVLLTTFGLLSLVAYEKIPLGSPAFRAGVSDMIIGLPFMPKTSKFLLRKTFAQHKTVTHANINFSLAATSNSFSSTLGSSSLDVSVKGPYDYTNIKAPKFDVDVSLTKDLNANVRLVNKKLYLKLNKVPEIVTVLLQTQAKIVTDAIGKWYFYDISTRETDAQKNLAEYKTKPTAAEQSKAERIQKILNEDIIPEIVKSEESLNDIPTYRLHLNVTRNMIDAFERESNRDEKGKVTNTSTVKTSDMFEDFQIDQWIDRKNYYTRKVLVQMKIKSTRPDDTLSYSAFPIPGKSATEPMDVVASLQLSNFEKVPNIIVPQEATKLEDYIKAASLMQETDSYYAQLKADMKVLANAISKYKDDRGVYPTTIGMLSPRYITAIELNTFAAEQITYINSRKRQVGIIYATSSPTPTDNTKYYVIYVKEKGAITATELTKEEFMIEQKSF